ncbi:MAG: hypothetical protein GY816_06815 [Cytophagales bacterium]|nr:hypothetical protein [Cytophagales bacterium]
MNNLKVKTEKGLVKKLRAIRDRMNEEMQDMTFEEMKAYLRKMRERNSPQQTI